MESERERARERERRREERMPPSVCGVIKDPSEWISGQEETRPTFF